LSDVFLGASRARAEQASRLFFGGSKLEACTTSGARRWLGSKTNQNNEREQFFFASAETVADAMDRAGHRRLCHFLLGRHRLFPQGERRPPSLRGVPGTRRNGVT